MIFWKISVFACGNSFLFQHDNASVPKGNSLSSLVWKMLTGLSRSQPHPNSLGWTHTWTVNQALSPNISAQLDTWRLQVKNNVQSLFKRDFFHYRLIFWLFSQFIDFIVWSTKCKKIVKNLHHNFTKVQVRSTWIVFSVRLTIQNPKMNTVRL